MELKICIKRWWKPLIPQQDFHLVIVMRQLVEQIPLSKMEIENKFITNLL